MSIYFKDSDESVTIKASVEKVLQFPDLNRIKVKELLEKYGKDDGIEDTKKFYQMFKDKKYCILIFLKNPRKIDSFKIDESGFGFMSTWIGINNVNNIKKLMT